jgi:hypothetical protein
MNTRRTSGAGGTGRASRAGCLLLLLASAPLIAQGGEIDFTAVSANVAQPGVPVRIRLMRWSTDEERGPIVAALNPAPADSVAATTNATSTTSTTAGRGAGRGGRGRGGRGRGAPAAPLTPTAALTAALGRAPTVGYIWTTDVTGYSIKYAYHAASPGGGERIVLATDRRLGAYSPAWKLAAPGGAEASAKEPADYEFTFVEIHLDAKGAGEGKTSLTTKVVPDNEARTVALDNYAATPAILEHVKR